MMPAERQIEIRWRPRETVLQGERVIVTEVVVPHDAPAEVKEGLARRGDVNAGGVCPCGARMVLPERAARRRAARRGQAIEVTVHHERGCPALLPGYRMIDLGPADGGS
jgi:hypothetical protein